MVKLIGVKEREREREREREERGLPREVRRERFARRERLARGKALRSVKIFEVQCQNFDSKYIHAKNTFKAIK